MKSFIVPIISAVVLGYLCANYVIGEYTNISLKEESTVYFLEIEDDINIKNKLILKEDKDNIYIGMTMDLNIANKIKDIYEKDNINIKIQEKNLNNISFISSLEQYDILLKNSTSRKEIESILGSIISSFEESLNNT